MNSMVENRKYESKNPMNIPKFLVDEVLLYMISGCVISYLSL